MAENSYPWSGTLTGDAGPYTYTEWNDVWGALEIAGVSGGRSADYNVGVLWGIGNNLYPQISGTDVDIETGAALVDGLYYESTAEESIAIPAPAANPRIDYIVVRKDYTNQTARLTRIAGVEAGAPVAPSMTQDVARATYWDIPICTIQVAVGGVLSNLSDEREFANANVGYSVITDDDASLNTVLNLIVSVDGASGNDELGGSLDIFVESNAGTLRKAASFQTRLTDSTDGGEESRIVLTTLSRGEQRDRAVFATGNEIFVSGNARGGGATDLQGHRTNATEIASGNISVICGGEDSTASGEASFIGGGSSNDATAQLSVIVGGSSNDATGTRAVVVGGLSNTASGDNSFIGGGSVNTASANYACSISGNNNLVSGEYSVIPGGRQNTADGNYCFAAGRKSDTNTFAGVFIWGDSTDAAFAADRANQFKVRCFGGSYFISSTASVPAMELEQDEDAPVLELNQDDDDSPFIEYDGASAADQTKNISTVNGDGAVDGPKNFSASAGWTFEGMVRVSVNETDYWMPFYSEDTA